MFAHLSVVFCSALRFSRSSWLASRVWGECMGYEDKTASATTRAAITSMVKGHRLNHTDTRLPPPPKMTICLYLGDTLLLVVVASFCLLEYEMVWSSGPLFRKSLDLLAPNGKESVTASSSRFKFVLPTASRKPLDLPSPQDPQKPHATIGREGPIMSRASWVPPMRLPGLIDTGDRQGRTPSFSSFHTIIFATAPCHLLLKAYCGAGSS